MYFVLYDKNLSPIGNAHLLESWSRIQRAVDFDDMTIVGEQLSYTDNPFLVTVHDKRGRYLFSGLASTPIIDDNSKKSTVVLKDYRTLFNTEVIINWGEFTTLATLKDYIDRILTVWKEHAPMDQINVSWDTSALSEVWVESVSVGKGYASYKVKDLIFNAMKYYSVYSTYTVDLHEKELKFKFDKAYDKFYELKLSDFNVPVLSKSFGEFNHVTVYKSDYTEHSTWAITEDNSLVRLPSDKQLIFPVKNKNYIASEDTEASINEAEYEAVMSLADNLYQESVEMDVAAYKSLLDLSTVDFSYTISVYSGDSFYKELPVGEIETNSNGKHIVRLGYQVQELTQEV